MRKINCRKQLSGPEDNSGNFLAPGQTPNDRHDPVLMEGEFPTKNRVGYSDMEGSGTVNPQWGTSRRVIWANNSSPIAHDDLFSRFLPDLVALDTDFNNAVQRLGSPIDGSASAFG